MSSLIFIGTGSGKVSLNRFHSSFIVSHNNFNLLVDAGDGVSKALLNQNISFNDIDGIIFTHLHPDHFSGYASLIVQMKLINREKRLIVFINENLLDTIKNFLYCSYLFEKKMGFDIQYVGFNENSYIKISESFEILARQNCHLNEYKIYDEKKKLNFSCSSLLFKIKDKNIFYSGDIGDWEDLLLFKDFRIDKMIIEVSHYDLNRLTKVYNSVKPEKIYLIHIGENDEEKIQKFLNFLTPSIRQSFLISFDGLQINL